MARNNQNHIYIPADPEHKPSWFWVIAMFVCGSFTGPIGPAIGVYLAYKRLKREGQIKKLSDFRRMATLIGDRGWISIRELTTRLGMTESDVEQGLQEMIDKGYIANGGYIDHSTHVLYLDPSQIGRGGSGATININIGTSGEVEVDGGTEYASRPQHRVQRRPAQPTYASQRPQPNRPGHIVSEAPADPEPVRPAEQPKPAAKSSGTGNDDFEAKLREIRELNDAIDDPGVSARIDRIGELTASIFRVVREKPEHADEVRKFMNYYLPTTFKLLKSYSLMEKQSYQGETIQSSRKKIEDILDTLIRAFEQQQDRLFRSEALDVESDISVLETMMASDGLLDGSGGLTLRPGTAAGSGGGSGRK